VTAGCRAVARVSARGSNSTSSTDRGLTPNTPYTYEVRAINNGGASAWSNQVSVTTGAVPAAPSGLTASVASSTQINLTWTDNSNNETAFAVWRTGGGSAFARVAALAENS